MTQPRSMRAAILQMTSGIDPAANVAAIADALAAARRDGADMLFTPEMALLLDRNRARSAAHIHTEAACPHLARLCEATARSGLWLQLGSAAFLADDDTRQRVNRSLLIDPAGDIRARYDKIHLFDVALPGGENWRESDAYRPGRAPVVADTPWGRLGFAICFDLRFGALFEALAAADADLISVPAAFTRPTGAAHWHVLLRARAIEHGCHIVASAQTGEHADGRTTYGHSLAVGPWGEVLADLGEPNGLAIVDLDLGTNAARRAALNIRGNRRAIAPVE